MVRTPLPGRGRAGVRSLFHQCVRPIGRIRFRLRRTACVFEHAQSLGRATARRIGCGVAWSPHGFLAPRSACWGRSA